MRVIGETLTLCIQQTRWIRGGSYSYVYICIHYGIKLVFTIRTHIDTYIFIQLNLINSKSSISQTFPGP